MILTSQVRSIASKKTLHHLLQVMQDCATAIRLS